MSATLGSVEKGWNARGRLKEHWHRAGGRDGLAAITGIRGETLSSYNSGKRPLGQANAERIAVALGVSVADLGAPLEAAVDGGLVGRRLAALEATVAANVETIAELQEAIRLLRLQVERQEAAPGRVAQAQA